MKTVSQRSAILQDKIEREMNARKCSYTEAFTTVANDPDNSELMDAMHRSPVNANRAAGTVATTMNRAAADQKNIDPGERKPGQHYPDGFAAGPRVNALRAAGGKANPKI